MGKASAVLRLGRSGKKATEPLRGQKLVVSGRLLDSQTLG